MTFRLENMDQLPTLLGSLQDLILSKHEGSKLCLEKTYDLEFGGKLEEEVKSFKLDTEPNIASTYGFQMRFYRNPTTAVTGVTGFCKANFIKPDENDERVWARVQIPLITMKIHDEVLKRGLKDRKIHIGLNNAYIRKLINDNTWAKWSQNNMGLKTVIDMRRRISIKL